MPDKAAPPSLPQTRYAYWAQSFGAWGNFGSNGNAADVGRKFGGFMSGIDARFAGNWQAGFAGGYSQSNITISDRSSSALVDTAHAAAYAGTSVGAWNLRAGAAFAWHIVDTNRTVDFPGFFDRDTANYHAATAQVFGEIGYGMALGPLALEPFAGIAHVRLSSNGFAETGGDAKLSVASATDDVTYSTLGLRAAADFALATNFVVTPRVTGAWQHAFGGVTPTDALTFQSAATTFAIWGVPVTRDSLLVDAGFDVRLTPQVKVGASYFGQFASRVRDNAVKGDLTWNF
jgi:outer membrane autotransporter protein